MVGDAGNKWIVTALIHATVECGRPDIMLGCFWIRSGVDGGYVASVMMI